MGPASGISVGSACNWCGDCKAVNKPVTVDLGQGSEKKWMCRLKGDAWHYKGPNPDGSGGGGVPVRCAGDGTIMCASNNGQTCKAEFPPHSAYEEMASSMIGQVKLPLVKSCEEPEWSAACAAIDCKVPLKTQPLANTPEQPSSSAEKR